MSKRLIYAEDAIDAVCDRECEYSKQQRSVMCGACHLGSAFDAIEQLPSAQPEQAIKDCRNCKFGDYNDHWNTNFCYYSGDCNSWDKWEPSTQPKHTEERTETHACDCISRQAAIDEAYDLIIDNEVYRVVQVETLIGLPSTQPEIIRCNVCRHWHQTTGEMKGFGLGDCDYLEKKLVTCNGYCYWAERKEDE